jgi:hypothetical protein
MEVATRLKLSIDMGQGLVTVYRPGRCHAILGQQALCLELGNPDRSVNEMIVHVMRELE